MNGSARTGGILVRDIHHSPRTSPEKSKTRPQAECQSEFRHILGAYDRQWGPFTLDTKPGTDMAATLS